MKTFILPIALLAAGCATAPTDMNAAKITWAGVAYDQVVARWGQPIHYTTQPDGAYVYTWDATAVAPGGHVYPSLGFLAGSGGGVGIGAGVAAGPGGGELVRCTRTLVFRDARVAEQTWQGDPAFCDSFRR